MERGIAEHDDEEVLTGRKDDGTVEATRWRDGAGSDNVVGFSAETVAYGGA